VTFCFNGFFFDFDHQHTSTPAAEQYFAICDCQLIMMQPDMNSSAPPRPSMTPEENEQVQKFLSELEKMETEDPPQFAQYMAQLGLGAGSEAPEGGAGGVGNAKNVVEAISQMRASAAEGMSMNTSNKDIQLPDGKTMSKGGVQAKVSQVKFNLL
jgi:hypothetical protein